MAVKKGYKQSSEHVARRIKRGQDHPNWLGDCASEKAGRSRALRLFPSGPCIRCDDPNGERHHKDGDTLNNDPNNVEMLCRKCHMKSDGRLQAFAKQAQNRDRTKDNNANR